MSLTSYRAAPPRGGVCIGSGVVARRRPTLPQLEMQYHGRSGVSRPSSGWDRVYHPRDDHRTTTPDPRLGSGVSGWIGWILWVKSRFGAACGAALRPRYGGDGYEL